MRELPQSDGQPLRPIKSSVGLIATSVIFTLLVVLLAPAEGWMRDYPVNWVWTIAQSLTVAVKYVVNDLAIGGVTLAEVTRGLADILEIPMLLLQGLLFEGFEFYGDDNSVTTLRGLPWPAVVFVIVTFVWWAGGYALRS